MNSKRLLSLVLALAMILGTFSFVSAASDIEGTVYEDAVDRLELLGILQGYPDGTFKPDNQITRAEFAAVVVRAKGLESAALAGKGAATGFTDVPATHWASGYVGTAAKLGIVNGIGNNLFAPEAPVKYEEAITMIMRALGYDPAAKEKGGYPFGYMITASETGLLDKVHGTQGLPAVRGIVAQLADNALEIPLMVRSGYGDQALYVVSGTHDTKEKTLLDEMGFGYVEGVLKIVNKKANKVKIVPETGRDVPLKVAKGFDFFFAEELKVKAWMDEDDNLVVYKVLEDAIYGAAKVDGEKIKADGTKYTVAKNAKLILNGKEDVKVADFDADYAKVVLNDDGDIRWAKGYTLPEYLIVAKVDGDEVYDYDNYGVKLKDFTLLFDGKTISVDDIEEEDVLLFNKTEDFAIIYNKSVEGEIERVYSNQFRVDGKVYDIAGKYLDGKSFGNLDKDVLDAMKKQEGEVEVFLTPKDKVVLVIGDRGEVTKTSSYAYVILSKLDTSNVRGDKLAIDVRNAEGKKVSYDIDKKDGKFADLAIANAAAATALEKTVVKLTVDKDGKVTKITELTKKIVAVGTDLDLKKTYAEGYKLVDDTLIFYKNGDKAVALKDAGFTKVKSAIVYADKDKAAGIVGDAEDADVNKITDLVTKVLELKSGEFEFTLFNKDRYTTDAKKDFGVAKNGVYTLHVGKKSELVENATAAAGDTGLAVTSRGDNKVTAGGKTYTLTSGAKIYDVTDLNDIKTISLLDLAVNDTINVYYDEGSTIYVQVITRTAKAGKTDPGKVATDGTVTFIDPMTSADRLVSIGSKEYKVSLAALNFFKDYVYVGDEIAFELNAAGDIAKVTVLKPASGKVTVDTDTTFTDLIIVGDLVVNAGKTLTTKGVTVKGDVTVNGTLISNTTFEGDVIVNGTASFTNVTLKKALKVTSTGKATIKNTTVADLEVVAGADVAFVDKVTVTGEAEGLDNVDTSKADKATKDAVEKAIEDKKDAEEAGLVAAANDALDAYEAGLEALEAVINDSDAQWDAALERINKTGGLKAKAEAAVGATAEDPDAEKEADKPLNVRLDGLNDRLSALTAARNWNAVFTDFGKFPGAEPVNRYSFGMRLTEGAKIKHLKSVVAKWYNDDDELLLTGNMIVSQFIEEYGDNDLVSMPYGYEANSYENFWTATATDKYMSNDSAVNPAYAVFEIEFLYGVTRTVTNP